jgi:ferric-dicitrate binding protein FerR (iron transport regulator)
MSGPRDCQEVFELRSTGDLSPEEQREVDVHLEQCAECRSEYREMDRLMDLLRSEEVPEISADRIQAMEEATLSEAAAAARDDAVPLPASRREGPPAWARVSVGILAAAGVAALVAAAVIFFSRQSDRTRETAETKTGHPKVARKTTPAPVPSPGPELPTPVAAAMQGAVAVRTSGPGIPAFDDRPMLNKGTEIETRGTDSAVLLTAAGGLELQIGPETILKRLVDPGWAFRIERGSIQVNLAGADHRRRLAVLTPRGTVSVTGTRFLVSVRTNRVSVTVFRGGVTYHRSGRSALALAQGRKMVDGPAGPKVTASVDTPPRWLISPPTAVAAVPTPDAPKPGAEDCRTGRIRSLLKKGSARRALALIRACKSERGMRAVDLATLQAEALLAAGRVGSAVRAYHRIARRYRGSRAAENALFAAGQLEMTRLGRKKRALATFKKYLARYPQGRYRSDVRRLIRLLEKRPDGTK